MKKSILLLFAGLLFLTSLGNPVAGQVNPWPMFRQNPLHSGLTTLAGPLAPETNWRFNTTGFTYSSPVITATRIYIASDTELIAIDHNGIEQWAFTFDPPANPPAVELSGFVSTPAVAQDGTIYIGSLDENLYALNPDGTLRWTHSAGSQVFSSPTIGPEGTIFIGTRNGELLAVNPDGTRRWTANMGGEVLSSPAIGNNGNIYIGSTNNLLYCFNNNGSLVWTFQAGGDIVSSPAVSGNGNIYFGALNNSVYGLNSAGQAIWNQPFPTGDIVISSPAVAADGTVYIGSFDNNVYAINGITGAEKWTFTTNEYVAASPAIDSAGNIFITSLDGSLYVLEDDNTDFNLLWSFSAGNPIWASPSIGSNTTVYIVATGTLSQPGRLFSIGEAVYDINIDIQGGGGSTGVGENSLVEGQDATFNIDVTNTQEAATGTFFYRTAGDAIFNQVPFTGSLTVPGSDVRGPGFQFYVAGNAGSFPSNLPSFNPANRRVRVTNATAPEHFFPFRYRMVSVPFNLDDKSLSAVLQDDYQEYGPQNWRLHKWNRTAYQEFPNIDYTFEPGQAFFLATASGNPFDVDGGVSISTSQPYPIALKPGWNQIGNPFGFPVSWSRVIRDQEVVHSLAFFNGAEMIQDPEDQMDLEPWEGYFIFNASDEETTIQIPPEPANIEIVDDGLRKTDSHVRPDVLIQIAASADGMMDSQNWAGLHEDAATYATIFNQLEAPAFGESLQLSLIDNNQHQAVSYKSSQSAGIWSFEIKAPEGASFKASYPVDLTFSTEFVRNLTADNFAMYLRDVDHDFVVPISDNKATVDWGSGHAPRRFELIAGTPDQLDLILTDADIAPNETGLSPNFPNPFQQQTRIGYQLSNRDTVTLSIYNVLGQKIQTLVDATQNPGNYHVTWNGEDASGQRVPSGVYVYKLQAGASVASGKMTLIR